MFNECLFTQYAGETFKNCFILYILGVNMKSAVHIGALVDQADVSSIDVNTVLGLEKHDEYPMYFKNNHNGLK